jgi:hypothetical protein
MSNIPYGISDVIVGGDKVKSRYVFFGDGKTRITTMSWEESRTAGVQIVRDGIDTTAFKTYRGKEAEEVNNLPNSQKVYLSFDCHRSIDLFIARLKEAKSLLPTPEQELEFEAIAAMSHSQMAHRYRFAKSGDEYFDGTKPYYKAFMERFHKLGGMSVGISKSIGW